MRHGFRGGFPEGLVCLAVPDPASYASVRICVGDMVSPPDTVLLRSAGDEPQLRPDEAFFEAVADPLGAQQRYQTTATDGMRHACDDASHTGASLAVAEASGLHRMHACNEEVAYTYDMRASGLRLLSAHSPCVGFGRTASSITEWATTTKKHPRDVVRVPLAVHAPRSDALAGSLSSQLDCLCRCRSSSTAWPAPRR
jgi:hypothetical protein